MMVIYQKHPGWLGAVILSAAKNPSLCSGQASQVVRLRWSTEILRFAQDDNNSKPGTPSKRRRAFTLLELLVVVFILAAIALSVVSLTDQVDQQFRFEETKNRLENIKKATVGDPSRDVNGGAIVSGFVADFGRLPNNLEELVENSGGLPTWQLDATSGQWFGWRGPYLDVFREASSGLKAARDGWGNTDTIPANDALFFGWNFAVDQAAGDLTVQSFGSDGQPGGIDFADDYPAAGDFLAQQDDHLVNIRGLQVTVRFTNPTDGDSNNLPKNESTFQVRLYYVSNGSIVSVNSDNELKLKEDVQDGEFYDFVFQFDPGVDQFVPWGVRSMNVVKQQGNSNNFTVYLPGSNPPAMTTFIPRAQLPSVGPIVWNLE